MAAVICFMKIMTAVSHFIPSLDVAASADEFSPEQTSDFHIVDFVKRRIKMTQPVFHFHQVVDVYYMALADLYKAVVNAEYRVF